MNVRVVVVMKCRVENKLKCCVPVVVVYGSWDLSRCRENPVIPVKWTVHSGCNEVH